MWELPPIGGSETGRLLPSVKRSSSGMGPAPGLGGAEMLVPATGMKKEKSLQIPAHELLGLKPRK